MNRKQFKALADKRYQTDVLTPLERRRKALEMKGLPKEKIEEVQALIDSGAKRSEIVEQTGISPASYDRIKNGQLTADKPEKPEKPASKPKADKPAEYTAVLEVRPDLLTDRDMRVLRELISQTLRALAGAEGEHVADDHTLGTAVGMLTAAELLLGGREP